MYFRTLKSLCSVKSASVSGLLALFLSICFGFVCVHAHYVQFPHTPRDGERHWRPDLLQQHHWMMMMMMMMESVHNETGNWLHQPSK